MESLQAMESAKGGGGCRVIGLPLWGIPGLVLPLEEAIGHWKRWVLALAWGPCSFWAASCRHCKLAQGLYGQDDSALTAR